MTPHDYTHEAIWTLQRTDFCSAMCSIGRVSRFQSMEVPDTFLNPWLQLKRNEVWWKFIKLQKIINFRGNTTEHVPQLHVFRAIVLESFSRSQSPPRSLSCNTFRVQRRKQTSAFPKSGQRQLEQPAAILKSYFRWSNNMETDDDDDPQKSESWACGVLVSR